MVQKSLERRNSQPYLHLFSRFIADTLSQSEVTVWQFAQKSGLATATIYGLINGEQEPKQGTLETLANDLTRVCGVSVSSEQLSTLISSGKQQKDPEYRTQLIAQFVEGVTFLKGVWDEMQRSGLLEKLLEEGVQNLPQVSSGRTMQVHHPKESLISSTQSIVSYMLLGTLEREQLSRGEFVDRAGADLTAARFGQIADEGAKPTELEYKALVRALKSCGQDWHWTMLDRLYSTPITKPIVAADTNNS